MKLATLALLVFVSAVAANPVSTIVRNIVLREFRAVDKNADSNIDAVEFANVAAIIGYVISKEDAADKIKKVTSGKDVIAIADLPKAAVKLAGMAFDHDGNGGVTKEEIIETLAKTDVANVITSEAFKWAFEAADLDDNGTLDGDEAYFIVGYILSTAPANPISTIVINTVKREYRAADRNGDGVIDAHEFAEVAAILEYVISDEKAALIIGGVTGDKDVISIEDLPNTAVKLAGMAFDHDGNGGVTKEEIIDTFANTDVVYVMIAEAFKWAFEAADLDGNGTLDGDEGYFVVGYILSNK